MADENNMESMILDMMNKLGGIEKFKSNPFAFIGEIFQHPELLGQIDKMAKTPEMQKQIAESMNNPMFQQTHPGRRAHAPAGHAVCMRQQRGT